MYVNISVLVKTRITRNPLICVQILQQYLSCLHCKLSCIGNAGLFYVIHVPHILCTFNAFYIVIQPPFPWCVPGLGSITGYR